jgi:protein-tyrosine phosphatase
MDVDRLRRDFGVTAVLSLQTDQDMTFWGVDRFRLEPYYRQSGVELRRAPVRDFDPDDLRRRLPQCVEALDELLRQGRIVYVHCNMGVNRSPSVAIAWLHWIEGWDLQEATAHVMKCRPCDPYVDVIQLAGEDRAGGKK